MNKNFNKYLFYLSDNSRITTKELSKAMRCSQQAASHAIKSLHKRKYIEHDCAIIDPARLGLINVLTGVNYNIFERKEQLKIISELSKENTIVRIEESDYGADLIIEYCVTNLSAFNKIHTELIEKIGQLQTKFIYPIIVKHIYPRSYLVNSKKKSEKIISGDRESIKLNERENEVLKTLNNNPRITLVNICKETGLNIKQVLKIKKELENKKIIRGYQAMPTFKKNNIKREIIFLKLGQEGEKNINKILEYCHNHKNIVEVSKIIGSSQILIIKESLKQADIIPDIRAIVPIEDYTKKAVRKVEKFKYY